MSFLNMIDEIISYGAFTVGVVADRGATLLEMDLAEQTNIFRELEKDDLFRGVGISS